MVVHAKFHIVHVRAIVCLLAGRPFGGWLWFHDSRMIRTSGPGFLAANLKSVRNAYDIVASITIVRPAPVTLE
jgi:hypothetical protein